jgi:hypothetical protein
LISRSRPAGLTAGDFPRADREKLRSACERLVTDLAELNNVLDDVGLETGYRPLFVPSPRRAWLEIFQLFEDGTAQVQDPYRRLLRSLVASFPADEDLVELARAHLAAEEPGAHDGQPGPAGSPGRKGARGARRRRRAPAWLAIGGFVLALLVAGTVGVLVVLAPQNPNGNPPAAQAPGLPATVVTDPGTVTPTATVAPPPLPTPSDDPGCRTPLRRTTSMSPLLKTAYYSTDVTASNPSYEVTSDTSNLKATDYHLKVTMHLQLTGSLPAGDRLYVYQRVDTYQESDLDGTKFELTEFNQALGCRTWQFDVPVTGGTRPYGLQIAGVLIGDEARARYGVNPTAEILGLNDLVDAPWVFQTELVL